MDGYKDLSLDENLNFLIQDKCSTAGVSCTFPETHHTSWSQDRAEFPVHFPAHILKFLRTGVGKVQESVQEILLYPELQEIQLFFQCILNKLKELFEDKVLTEAKFVKRNNTSSLLKGIKK